MRALRWFGRRQVRLEDLPLPEPSPNEVVLRVAYCGICGTDIEEYASGPLLIPVTPHPLTGRMAPLTLGHEFAGTVAARGSEVKTLNVGDRVVPEICLYCGTCVYCRAGKHALCQSWAAIGLHTDGGLADYVSVPAEACSRLPDSVTDQEAALIEPLEVAVRAVRKANLDRGGTLVITGAGPIGLLVLQVARAAGAGRIIVVEPREARRKLAGTLGADSTIVEVVGELAADAAIECAGRSESVQTAFESVRKGGRVVLVGIPTGSLSLDLMPLISGERQVVGSIQHQRGEDLEVALKLVTDRKVDLTALISDVIPLSAVAGYLENSGSATNDAIKVIVDVGGAG